MLKPVALPEWQWDLQQQIVSRNAAELKPCEGLFLSYALLYKQARALQSVEVDRQRLSSENEMLVARVRDLERVAADVSVRTAREAELEKKKESLQERLEHYIAKENEYYRGVAELGKWKGRAEIAEGKLRGLESDLAQRASEFALVKKEYVALKDEHEAVRTKVAEADRYLLELKSANSKLVNLHNTVFELEAEINRLRKELRDVREGRTRLEPPSGNFSGDPSAGGNNQDGPSSPFCASTRHVDVSAMASDIYPSRAVHRIVDGHSGGSIHAVCCSENGQRFYSAGSDKIVRTWDVATGGHVKSHGSNNLALSLDSSSHYLLAGCADRIARFWDVNTLRVLELCGHSEKIVSVCLSTSAQHAFTASSDSTIKVWDVLRRESLRTLLCQSTSNDIVIANENIYSAHYNGTVMVWDRRTATRTCEVRAHQRITTCVRVTHDGRLCVSLGRDNVVSVRDTRMMQDPIRVLSSPDISVSMNWMRLAVSPDKKVCAVGNTRGEVVLVALEEANEKERGNPIVAKLHDCGHEAGGAVHGVSWGKTATSALISFGEDRKMVVWQ